MLMNKFIDSHLRSRKIKRYQREAQKIEDMADSLTEAKQLSLEILAQNFQNLYGRTDRESMMMGFAIIVTVSEKVLKMRPYTVQVIGALAMADGHIAEMATGEGKTLTASMPLAWYGLQNRAHAMTVNDYLAQRDAEILTPLYEALGLSVSFLTNEMEHDMRQIAYRSNIIYGTPSQFVFDYLRDHIAYSQDRVLQSNRYFTLVDEADSIFIDEARTPMVLSGEGELNSDIWMDMYNYVSTLSHEVVAQDRRTQLEKIVIDPEKIDADIAVNRAEVQAFLTEQGTAKVEEFLQERGYILNASELWNTSKSYLWRIVTACVRARHLFTRDKDYIVSNDKVIIIDQETGRLAHGRRWSEGLHQAVEAKENVTIRPESKDMGRIALSNYLSLYDLRAGMTGTAMTEADEILDLYGMHVMPIPTHKPRIRIDHPDVVFMYEKAKINQITEDVAQIHATGQPVLVGTSSVEASEVMSEVFHKAGIPHRVLNARQDAQEALVIAQAGRLGAVTIATSMAGRGTDILLGGNAEILKNLSEEQLDAYGITLPEPDEREKVKAVGGLFVIGCERLDSPRLDLQLAGRAGRQGDPGASQFYISLEDDLMKDFGGALISSFFTRMGVSDTEGLQHSMISRSIAQAQSRKQSLYVASRKEGLKQDSVIDSPRKVFFSIRNSILYADQDDVKPIIDNNIEHSIAHLVSFYLNDANGFPETWNVNGFERKFAQWGLSKGWYDKLYSNFVNDNYNTESLVKEFTNWIVFDVHARLSQFGAEKTELVRQCLLMAVDRQWQIFLEESENIRNGIHLRAYAQVKPEQAFQKEVYNLFKALTDELPVIMLDYIYSIIMDRERAMEQGHMEQGHSVNDDSETEGGKIAIGM